MTSTSRIMKCSPIDRPIAAINHLLLHEGNDILTDMTSTSRIMKCSPIDRPIAAINHLLLHGGITMRDWFSLKLKTYKGNQSYANI